MKVLEVITSMRTGGAENLVTELAPLLNDESHQVDVLLFDGSETPFLLKLKEHHIHVLSLGYKFYDVGYVFKLIPILKQYDVVHTHNTACQLYVVIAKVLSHAKCKLVTTEHSTDNRRRHLFWFKPIDLWMYRHYSVIISISQIATDILSHYLRGKFAIETISNGVNVSKFKDATPYDEKVKCHDEVVLIMVAAFRIGKQQEVLIHALEYLPSNYKVWLVGDGIRRQECEDLARKKGVGERVKFWGVRTDVPRLLKTADIIVMSTHYEGMSLSNIEGMSAGRPFIASDVNGIREITSGAGLLFQEGNAQDLAEKVLLLMTDKNKYDAVVASCLNRAREYDITKTVEGYRNVYNRLNG